ncbi:MAG: hypothetical protein EA385_15675 [Salinarimonadaceae bacterium]|nr:MAG: hypothetical protein EA385_15675 [Salinarimonadaceae bacterium]
MFVLNPGEAGERTLPSSVGELGLEAGDLLSIRTPGGAGFGDPRARDRTALERDLREGRIGSRAVYGFSDSGVVAQGE